MLEIVYLTWLLNNTGKGNKNTEIGVHAYWMGLQLAIGGFVR